MILKEVIDKGIKEEGERMVPAFHKGNLVYGEHISRYESVKDILKDKVVLDIASGSGYGTYVLSEKAKKIYGVDVDAGAVKYAKKNYPRKNIEYLLGDAEKIPLEDNSIDAVITFETIEHIKDYKKFLDEIKRVLRPDGFAVISTPNDPEFPEGNHFHLHEFEEKELDQTLKGYFKNTKFSYQYTWLFAGVLNAKTADSEGSKRLLVENAAPVPSTKAIYFMVLCSDNNLDGLEVKELAAISEHWSARDQQARQLDTNEKYKQMVASRDTAIQELTRRDKQLNDTQNKLTDIYTSRGWKLLTTIHTIKYKFIRVFRRK